MEPIQDEMLRRLAAIIKTYGIMPAENYDSLDIDKPPRRSLYRKFGKWQDVINAALPYIDSPTPPPSDTDERVLQLQKQVQELTRHIQTPKLCLEGVHHKFGYVSDTHLGSLYSDKSLLSYAYDVFESEKIKTVFHSGDIADGQKMFKGHEYELEVMGTDAQVSLIQNLYPQRKGITTYYITGNHDRSFWKDGGNDIGMKIAKDREDMICLGHQEADIKIGKEGCQATIRLFHPDGGTAYAISYHSQRYVSELPSGTKPDILLLGHYHKAEVLYYRGVCVIQGGTTQMQTPFMRGRKISAAMGFWIIEVTVAPERVVSVASKFFPVRT